MLQRRYHYLIAGLPDLSFEEQKPPITVVEFCKQLFTHLHPEDYEQISLVLLNYDNKNLIHFLKDNETEYTIAGNYKAVRFRDQVDRLNSILPEKDILPGYMVNLIKQHYDVESAINPDNYEMILAEGYYHHIMNIGSPFLKMMTEFDYNINNLLTAFQTGKYNLFLKGFIVGENSLAMHLKRIGGRNLVSDSEFDFFNEILGYAGIQSYAEAERKYDILRWKMIDEATFFENFSIDWLLGYLHKLLIIRRWSNLNHDSGIQRLREMITETKEKLEII